MMAQLEAPHAKQATVELPPAGVTEPVAAHSHHAASSSASDPAPEYAHLAEVPMRLEAVLGRLTMNMRAVASLEEGTVLTLNRSAGDNVDLCVSGVDLASGEIVVIEDTLGVRITDLMAGD
jgi:flagellar motor switch protein FliN